MVHGLITHIGDPTNSFSLRIVTLAPSTGRAAIDCYEGARVVVRHNTFNNAQVSAHGTEGQGRGTKQLEIYNNVFTVSPRRSAGQIRSGSVVVHDNVYNNFTEGIDSAGISANCHQWDMGNFERLERMGRQQFCLGRA